MVSTEAKEQNRSRKLNTSQKKKQTDKQMHFLLCVCVGFFFVLTIEILFNVTEVIRFWAADECMNVLDPILNNKTNDKQKE